MANFLHRVNVIGGAIVAALAAVLGQYWFLFAGLLFFNIIDWLTGWAKSSMKGESCSRVGAIGAMKKICYWVVIGTAFFIGFAFKAMGETIGMNLVFMDFVGWFTLANYLVNEIRSVLENLVEMNVPVPDFLVSGLRVTAEKIETVSHIGEDDKEDGTV